MREDTWRYADLFSPWICLASLQRTSSCPPQLSTESRGRMQLQTSQNQVCRGSFVQLPQASLEPGQVRGVRGAERLKACYCSKWVLSRMKTLRDNSVVCYIFCFSPNLGFNPLPWAQARRGFFASQSSVGAAQASITGMRMAVIQTRRPHHFSTAWPIVGVQWSKPALLLTSPPKTVAGHV